MKTFVIPDLHGRHDALVALLKSANIINEDGERGMFSRDHHLVVQVGDMINGTMMDWNNDEQTMKIAEDLVDYWIMGNHDICYHYPHVVFQGFAPSPVIKSGVDRWFGSGKMIPALAIGDTLITHAGVHEDYDFDSATEACEAITKVWIDYSLLAFPRMAGTTYSQKPEDFFRFRANRKEVELPKAALLDGIGFRRGGASSVGGIMWADWDEPKNHNFNQIVGHTPIKEGPVTIEYRGSDRIIVNIDTGAKSGLNPTGVWLNSDGEIEEFVTASIPTEMAVQND